MPHSQITRRGAGLRLFAGLCLALLIMVRLAGPWHHHTKTEDTGLPASHCALCLMAATPCDMPGETGLQPPAPSIPLRRDHLATADPRPHFPSFIRTRAPPVA
ncbi:MAG: hypothetical protein EP335_17835 [Alphaproteobacteria bacterium]|nr:MAG: hypothetical protein EP335_17835 [Alphaproteobacteria bacterium]